jgi:uncharacterized protein (DUF1330 family)
MQSLHIPDYAENLHDIVRNHGGKYLYRSGNITTIEGRGSGTTVVALLEFASMQAVQAFYNDPAYANIAKLAKPVASAGSISSTAPISREPFLN